MSVTSLDYLTPNEQAAITEYVARIRGHFRNRVLAAMMLFGSKARGDADSESDIDLLVLVDVESSEFRSQLWRIASDVSLEYDVVLSPRVFGQERWDETRRIRLPLYRAIVADGVPLTPERVPA
jgi:predicted nucleotidyltransferase